MRTAGTGADEHTAVFAAVAEDVTHVVVDGRVVFRQGDREELGRDLAAAIDRIWEHVMTRTVITGIGELVTNAPEAAGPARHDHGRGARRRGLDGRLGRARGRGAGRRRAGRRGRPRRAPRLRRLPLPPGLRRRPRARSSRPGWPASRYAAGGIRTTVAATRAATDEQLTSHVGRLVQEMRRQGTTTVEIKSGYGLTVHDEARSLAVARQFTEETTFLGRARRARRHHPGGVRRAGHRPDARGLRAARPLGRRVLRARGLRRRPGPRRCSRRGPRPDSAAGCTPTSSARDPAYGSRRSSAWPPSTTAPTSTDDDVAALRDSGTIATLLPGVEFSTRQPYPDARRLLDAGVRVALATDCNPGSCFTSSMPLCIALAVREMGMTPGEAVHAATATAAAALDRDDVGVLAPGRRADFVLLDAPSHVHLAYRPGVPLVAGTWVGGRPV